MSQRIQATNAASPPPKKEPSASSRGNFDSSLAQSAVQGENRDSHVFESVLAPALQEAASASSSGAHRDYKAQACLYGHKAASLMQLQQIIQDSSFDHLPLHVAIPPFFALASERVWGYLEDAEAWKRQLMEAVQAYLVDHEKNKLQDIQTRFAEVLKHSLIIQGSSFLKSLPSRLLLGPLMVRSSGWEDLKETSNAGGNLTCSGVEPSLEALAEAIGKVVASYIGSRSLDQLQAAGATIDHRILLAPVCLQQMIGERPDDRTPLASGVLFTQNPTLPTGCSVAQWSYGHGEGVVTGQVPCDVAFLSEEKDRLILREKTFRLRTGSDGTLETVQNPPDWVHRCALSLQARRTLAKIAKVIESAYGCAQDIEWVYRNGTIYLVQSRPIVANPFVEASYVDPEAPLQVYVANDCPNPAGGACCVVESSSQLLMRPFLNESTLQEALHDPKPVAILVQETPGFFSHEVTTLRQLGIPIFVFKKLPVDIGRCIVDPQSRCLWSLPKDEEASSFIRRGLKRYPLVPALSLPKRSLEDCQQALVRFNQVIGYQQVEWKLALAAYRITSVESLLDQLCDFAQPQRAQVAALALSRSLKRLLKNSQALPQDTFLNLCCEIADIHDILLEVLSTSTRSERLLALTWLEAKLRQGSEETLGTSLKTWKQDQINHVALNASQRASISDDKLPFVDALGVFSRLTINQTFNDEWIQKAIQLISTHSAKELQVVLDQLTQAHAAGVLSDWINGSGSFSQQSLEELAMLTVRAKASFTQPLRLALAKWEVLLPHLADKKFAEKLAPCVVDELLKPFFTFVTHLQTIPFQDRQVYSSLYLEAIDCIDQTIKQFKALPVSPLIVLQIVTPMIEAWANGLIGILEADSRLEMNQGLIHLLLKYFLTDRVLKPMRVVFKQILQTARDCSDEIHASRLLVASKHFDVRASVMGAPEIDGRPNVRLRRGALIDFFPSEEVDDVKDEDVPDRVNFLESIDDIFTLVHRNYLEIFNQFPKGSLGLQAVPTSLARLTLLINNLHSHFEKQLGMNKPTVPTLKKIYSQQGIIFIHIDIPYRGHGLDAVFSCPKSGKPVTVKLKFYGNRLGNRWEHIMRIAQNLKLWNFTPLTLPFDSGVIFELGSSNLSIEALLEIAVAFEDFERTSFLEPLLKDEEKTAISLSPLMSRIERDLEMLHSPSSAAAARE